MSGSNVYTFAPSEIPTSVKLNAALANAASSGASSPFAATGAVALRTASTRAADVFRLVDFSATTDPDDTLALMRMYACWAANPRGGVMLFPTRRETILGVGASITMVAAAGQSLVLSADGGREARIRFASGFSGTFLTINGANSTSRPEGPTVRMEGLEFVSTSTGTIGQVFAINGAPGGDAAPSPSLVIEDIRLMNDEGGCWQQGGSIFAMNVTRVKRMHCFGWTDPSSVGLSYDTDTRISVEHDVEDFYMNGGGTGLVLGHTGATGPLQGFTVRRGSFTGNVNGVVATAAANMDQLLIDGAQFNCIGSAVSTTNCATVSVKGCYLLNNGTAIKITGAGRAMVLGNVFDIGAPTTQPGNGVNNLAVVMASVNGGSDSGSVVANNLFTNNYSPPGGGAQPPCVQITGTSNYVHVVGNAALQGNMILDTTGNPNNTDFGNYQHGGIQGFSLGSSAVRALMAVSQPNAPANLQVTPPPGGNFQVLGSLAISGPSGTSTFEAVANTGVITISTAGLMLAPRPGQTDNPGLSFDVATGGTTEPQIYYNPTLDKFVFNNKNGTPIASLDLSGNLRCLGTVVGSVTP